MLHAFINYYFESTALDLHTSTSHYRNHNHMVDAQPKLLRSFLTLKLNGFSPHDPENSPLMKPSKT